MDGEFAKLFGTGKNQVLIMLKEDDDDDAKAGAHMIEVTYDPHHDDLALCNISLRGYKSKSDARIVFEAYDELKAMESVRLVRIQIHEMLSGK